MLEGKFKVLSIDAWADGEDGWFWNNWYTVDHLDSLPEEKTAIDALIDLGLLNELARTEAYVEDDQYNLVIHEKETGMPLYAIEYGSMDSLLEAGAESHAASKGRDV